MADAEVIDVLVVGAGPTGLALACGLRLQGVGVRVVDRRAAPATTSRANFVHARGSEVLDRLGALGDLPERSVRAMRITTYLGDRPMMRVRFGDPGLRTAAPPMVVSQALVEDGLRRRLAELGGAPEWGARLTGALQDDDGVTAELSDGRTVRARWLVGCDGTDSAVRAAAGISAPGVRLSERFLLADLHLDWDLDRAGTSGWVHPDGMLGVMPMPDPDGRADLWRLIAYDPDGAAGEQATGMPDDAADAAGTKATADAAQWAADAYGRRSRLTEEQILDRFRAILPGRTGRQVRVLEPVWLSEFTIHRRLADRYRSGRVLVAGDAAHAHAPFGGQGMLTGLGDAENLAWKLGLVVRGLASKALVDTYEAERRPLAAEVLRGTANVTKVNVARSAAGRFLRDQVLVRLFNQPWVQRWATFTTSQLWVSYRSGPLGAGPGERTAARLTRRVCVGDRVPSLACTRADGRATRLHDELGGRWALLVPPAETGPGSVRPGPDDVGPDVEPDDVEPTRLSRTDGVPEAWLVRPDGHLAWRGTDPAGAGPWLAGLLRDGRVR
ncbi:FAD-dependent monooxygenase [Promicromonospora sukumoe]|uniref:4,5-epoxidase n=1 Tax=Promicromonospora sukumoe TaxID=88382 RepID=A0A7W3JAZ3_9MICO|nr:FAD-dependent monooxygenase [Promicromonospora sukumoe]MBA8809507.1 4,5-epoxidase [Promicromonospora sukumoe]